MRYLSYIPYSNAENDGEPKATWLFQYRKIKYAHEPHALIASLTSHIPHSDNQIGGGFISIYIYIATVSHYWSSYVIVDLLFEGIDLLYMLHYIPLFLFSIYKALRLLVVNIDALSLLSS